MFPQRHLLNGALAFSVVILGWNHVYCQFPGNAETIVCNPGFGFGCRFPAPVRLWDRIRELANGAARFASQIVFEPNTNPSVRVGCQGPDCSTPVPIKTDPGNTVLCRDYKIYLPATKKCYRYFKKGPCGELMNVQPNVGSFYQNGSLGECKCQIECNPPYLKGPMVFVKEESRCYELFAQGPCKRGEWLVLRNGKSLICEQIPCLDKYDAQPLPIERRSNNLFVFADEGTCYTVGGKGQWNCNADEYVAIDKITFKPLCQSRWPGIGCGSGGVSSDNDCEDGSAVDAFGGCEAVASFR